MTAAVLVMLALLPLAYALGRRNGRAQGHAAALADTERLRTIVAQRDDWTALERGMAEALAEGLGREEARRERG